LIPARRDRHPSIICVREDTLVPLLQEWLLGFFALEWVDQTLEALVGANGPCLGGINAARSDHRPLRDAEKRLAQYIAALGQGAEVALVSAWINEAVADISRARLNVATADSAVPQDMSRDELERPQRHVAGRRPPCLRLTYDVDTGGRSGGQHSRSVRETWCPRGNLNPTRRPAVGP
jgi:hypothetical protein